MRKIVRAEAAVASLTLCKKTKKTKKNLCRWGDISVLPPRCSSSNLPITSTWIESLRNAGILYICAYRFFFLNSPHMQNRCFHTREGRKIINLTRGGGIPGSKTMEYFFLLFFSFFFLLFISEEENAFQPYLLFTLSLTSPSAGVFWHFWKRTSNTCRVSVATFQPPPPPRWRSRPARMTMTPPRVWSAESFIIYLN